MKVWIIFFLGGTFYLNIFRQAVDNNPMISRSFNLRSQRHMGMQKDHNLILKFIFIFFCRDITSEILSERPEGSFVVRQSTSRPDCFALSVRVPSGSIAHYLINAVQSPEQSFFRIQVCVRNFMNF